jgi:hypothetical protein
MQQSQKSAMSGPKRRLRSNYLMTFVGVTLFHHPKTTTTTHAFTVPRPPSSLMLPEDVVEAQLKCFQEGDILEAFQTYMSKEAKIIMNNSWQVFTQEFDEEPFQPILEHTKSTVLMTIMGKETYESEEYTRSTCLVRLVPGNIRSSSGNDGDDDDESDGDDGGDKETTVPLQYWWELSRESGLEEWAIDSINPDFESLEIEDGLYFDEDGIWILGDDDDDDDGGDDDDDIFGGGDIIL